MRRTNMEVIQHQAEINKLTRERDYYLHKAKEFANKAAFMTKQGKASAQFQTLKAKEYRSKADIVSKKIVDTQHAFDNPDIMTRIRRFFHLGRSYGR